MRGPSTYGGSLWLAAVATSSISASTPAFSAVTLREPPRRNSPATTVWLPSRRLTRTFSPPVSSSGVAVTARVSIAAPATRDVVSRICAVTLSAPNALAMSP